MSAPHPRILKVVIPLALRYNPPPGWPSMPDGWLPGPDWVPDAGWPPAPAGWALVIADTSPRVVSDPVSTKSPDSGAEDEGFEAYLRRRRRYRVIGAITGAVAVGGSTIAWWLYHPPGPRASCVKAVDKFYEDRDNYGYDASMLSQQLKEKYGRESNVYRATNYMALTPPFNVDDSRNGVTKALADYKSTIEKYCAGAPFVQVPAN